MVEAPWPSTTPSVVKPRRLHNRFKQKPPAMRWFFGVLIWGVSYNEVMNLDDFSYVENDRRYVKPDVALNEQNAFIDNLRNTQAQDTAKIRQDTYNLGTAVPSNLGGLGGGSGYFKARYQTPQSNAIVAQLRSAAQSQALSTAMENEIAKAKKLYNDAYRAAKKRGNNNGGVGGGDGTTSKLNVNTNTGVTELEISEDPHKTLGFSVNDSGESVYHDGEGNTYILGNLTPGDNLSVAPRLPSNAEDGQIVTINNQRFIYNKGTGTWYRITG